MNIKSVSGLNNYIDDNFVPELIRRYKIEKELYNTDKLPEIDILKKEYNTVIEETYTQ